MEIAAPLSTTLPGTWALVSRVDVDDTGQPQDEPYLGSDPIALLFYDRSGHFSAQFMKCEQSATNVLDAPIAGSNNTRAQGGYDAYFGSYRVDDARTVTQRVTGARSRESVRLEITRSMRVEGDNLTIIVQTSSLTGKPLVRNLTWNRVG